MFIFKSTSVQNKYGFLDVIKTKGNATNPLKIRILKIVYIEEIGIAYCGIDLATKQMCKSYLMECDARLVRRTKRT